MVALNSPEQVARAVQERLNKTELPCNVRVIADAVRRGEGDDVWWYVPVAYQQDPYNAYRYFALFSQVEEELHGEHVSVLIVPRILPPPPDLNA